MNQKHAREARMVNRVVGTLAKRGDAVIHQHKLPRRVKREFDKLNHKQKRLVTRQWRGIAAQSLIARGVILKGDRKKMREAERARQLAAKLSPAEPFFTQDEIEGLGL